MRESEREVKVRRERGRERERKEVSSFRPQEREGSLLFFFFFFSRLDLYLFPRSTGPQKAPRMAFKPASRPRSSTPSNDYGGGSAIRSHRGGDAGR